MKFKNIYIIILLVSLTGCAKGTDEKPETLKKDDQEKNSEQELKLDSVSVEEKITKRKSTTEFFKLPNFDEYFEIVWKKELEENPNQNDYIIIDSILLSPDLIRQYKGINIRTGEFTNTLEYPIKDSIFRISNNPGHALINISKKDPLFETNWNYGISKKPELIKDSLVLFKVWKNRVSLYDRNNKKTVWTIDSLKSRIIRTFVLDSVVVIYMKDETQIFDKYSGAVKWSDNGNYYFTNDLVSNNQMILIHEKKGHIVKVNPSNGDTLLSHNFKKEYKSHILDNKTFYYIDDSTITSFDVDEWKINWSNKGRYFKINSDEQSILTFRSGKLHKIDKATGNLIWKTIDSDYGGQIIPAQTYILTEVFGMQEGGCPVVIDKKTGQPLSLHCINFEHDENLVFLSNINIYLYNTTPVFDDMLLVANITYPKTTYMLIKKIANTEHRSLGR